MAVDKNLLRMAICDGAFSSVRPARVTPDVLEAVAGMTDDAINAVLLVYKTAKLTALNARLSALTSSVEAVQGQIALLTG